MLPHNDNDLNPHQCLLEGYQGRMGKYDHSHPKSAMPKVRIRYTWVVVSILISASLVFYAIRRYESRDPLGSDNRSICAKYREECDSVAPFIFDSLHSLLKQWPNTYAPNGHTIVPVTLHSNTALYHAKQYSGKPKKPTWYAFDT